MHFKLILIILRVFQWDYAGFRGVSNSFSRIPCEVVLGTPQGLSCKFLQKFLRILPQKFFSGNSPFIPSRTAPGVKLGIALRVSLGISTGFSLGIPPKVLIGAPPGAPPRIPAGV